MARSRGSASPTDRLPLRRVSSWPSGGAPSPNPTAADLRRSRESSASLVLDSLASYAPSLAVAVDFGG
eukprot:4109-Pyramimonas_sp.AAC.1